MADAKLPSTIAITNPSGFAYQIVSTSKSTNTFTIKKDATTGVISRSCTTAGKGSCPSSGSW
jgi:hypothetical protein